MSRSDLPAQLAAVSDEVDRYLRVALVKGKASGIPRLRHRLAALDPTPPANLIAVEAGIWSASIDQDLKPRVRAVVLGVLRGDAKGRWLDLDARRERKAVTLDALETGLMDVRSMLHRHLASGTIAHVRHAVAELESLTHEYKAAIVAAPAPDECPVVAQLLGRSLQVALQPLAVSIYVADVRERIGSAVGGLGRHDRGRDGDQWLSRATWIQSTPDGVAGTTAAFTGSLQVRYEKARKELERARRAEVSGKEKQDAERASQEARRKAEATTAEGSAVAVVDKIDRKREVEKRQRDDLVACLRREIDPARLRGPASLATMSLEELLLAKQHLDWDARHDGELARRARDNEEHRARLGYH